MEYLNIFFVNEIGAMFFVSAGRAAIFVVFNLFCQPVFLVAKKMLVDFDI